MYKFEISADSPKELREKMIEFANEIKEEENKTQLPKYLDEPIEEITSGFEKPVPLFSSESTPQFPAATVVVSTAQGEVDSHGLPWDARIHADSKTKKTDGTWTMKRKLDPEFVKKVQDEIKTPHTPIVIPPVPPSAVHAELPKFDHTAQPGVSPFERQVPEVIAAPVQQYETTPIPQGNRPAHSLITFKNNLMILIAQLINEGKINHEYLAQLKVYFQVKEIWNILSSELQCIELYNTFAELGFITKVD